MNHTPDLLTIEDRRTVGLDGSPGGTIQINSPEGPIALLGKDKKAMAVKIVHQYNTYAALVEALREAKTELRMLNLKEDGTQKVNTPAAIRLLQIEEALALAEGKEKP